MRTIEFYKMYITKDGNITDLNPLLPLKKISNEAWDYKLYEKNILFNVKKDTTYSNISIIYGCVGKIRSKQKPYYLDIADDDIPKLIEKDLVEVNSFAYIPESHLFIYEKNQNGVSIKNLTSYINYFLGFNEDYQLACFFDPVEEVFNDSDLIKAEKINSITLTRNILSMKRNNDMNKGIISDHMKFENSIKKLGADSITYTLSKKKGDRSLNIKDVISLIDDLNIEDENLIKLQVEYKKKGLNKKSIVNLKDVNKHLKEHILENHNGLVLVSTIQDAIRKVYVEKYLNSEFNEPIDSKTLLNIPMNLNLNIPRQNNLPIKVGSV